MKKLFLHIGFPKTGSTSIQVGLVKNAEALAAQGILYPSKRKMAYMQNIQHLPLAAAIPGRNVEWLTPAKRQTLPNAYRSFFRNISNAEFHTLVVSSESFGGQDIGPKKVEWVRDQFADYDVTVIAYIRRQDSYILSTYQEAIKAGHTGRFDFEDYPNKKAMFFAQRLSPWRQVFGADKVIVRPFMPALWHQGDLFMDFLHLIGAAPAGLTPVAPSNEGLDYRAVELQRQLNVISTERRSGETRYAMRVQGFQDLVKKIPQVLPKDDGYKKMALSSEQAETLRLFFRDENIAALAGTGIDVDAFFPPVEPGKSAILLPEQLDHDILVRLLWGLTSPETVKEFSYK